jgi:Na+/H+ antiporter
MLLVELLVGLFAAAVALSWAARRANVPYPIALVLGGALLGFVPGLPSLPLDPTLILGVGLPPVLYQAALLTSWRDFRANIRAISLLAIGLVIATTVAVAATFKWLMPQAPWAAAFALGAIVSPPDAVAATAVLSRMNIPRRIVTILEGESLVNDASGLVLYRFAVAAALTGAFSLAQATWQFVLIAAGGIAVGVALGRLFVAIHKHLGDTLVEILLSLVLPYAAYLVAESVNLSGVLAVVAAGLVRARYAREAFSPEARLVVQSVWTVVVFLMNCFVFILIGLKLPEIVSGLGGQSVAEAIGYGLALSLVAIAVRMAWVIPATYLPRWLLAWLGWPQHSPPLRHVTVVGWCGMRGIVSLAAALALPLAFPERDLIVFVSLVVIVVTLVLPGLTLAPLVRALRVGGDWSVQDEQRLARIQTARAALHELGKLEAEGEITPDVGEFLRREAELRLARASPAGLVLADGDDPWCKARLALVRAERRRLIALWREGKIGDEVLHEIERELDFEESRLA